MEEEDVAEDEVEDDEVEEDDDIENDDDVEEEDDDVGDDDVEEGDRSQDLGPHFAWACTVEMHVNMSQEPLFTEIYRIKCRAPDWAQNADTYFVRACAVTMHVVISQEPLYTEIYRKNAAPKREHPDEAPTLTTTIRTPQCGHTVWRKTI